jgi:hypothetical protein
MRLVAIDASPLRGGAVTQGVEAAAAAAGSQRAVVLRRRLCDEWSRGQLDAAHGRTAEAERALDDLADAIVCADGVILGISGAGVGAPGITSRARGGRTRIAAQALPRGRRPASAAPAPHLRLGGSELRGRRRRPRGDRRALRSQGGTRGRGLARRTPRLHAARDAGRLGTLPPGPGRAPGALKGPAALSRAACPCRLARGRPRARSRRQRSRRRPRHRRTRFPDRTARRAPAPPRAS